MNKIELKCGGFVYIETLDDFEEQDRCKIYDENMVYLDYICVDNDDYVVDYYREIDWWQNIESPLEYFENNYRTVVAGENLDEFFTNYEKELYNWYYHDCDVKEIITEMREHLLEKGEQSFCENYLVNKIGNYYIYGDD